MSQTQTSSGDRIDLADVQGNVLTAYGKLGFPKGRFLTLHISDADKGREFITKVYPEITTALRWPSSKPHAPPPSDRMPKRPKCTLNLAFTFWGLFALNVPLRTLGGMPDEFVDGMRARAALLGDDYPKEGLDNWDPVWRNETMPNGADNVHILVTLNSDMDPETGDPVPEMEEMTEFIRQACHESNGGVRILWGHGTVNSGTSTDGGTKNGAEYQELSALMVESSDADEPKFTPSAHEHFGFFDGISDPVFEGQYTPDTEKLRVQGNGKLVAAKKGKSNWLPLATGEFLLGYRDEAHETPPAASPHIFSRNGTFMAYRKLYEDVSSFDKYLDDTAAEFGQIYGIDDVAEARATLMAKFAGRWSDGVPLSLAPTYAEWEDFNRTHTDPIARYQLLSEYDFADDESGAKCPASSHIRRVNPRDSLGPEGPVDGKPGKSGSALINRRRILRRGLPYEDKRSDGTSDQGIVMLICCASLIRQYEFVQQQWLNYGMDNNAGNDTCPLLGTRPGEDVKFVIPGDQTKGQRPFFCTKLPQFVETRGGAYFFVPSMTALRMIAIGMIDPT